MGEGEGEGEAPTLVSPLVVLSLVARGDEVELSEEAVFCVDEYLPDGDTVVFQWSHI